VTRSWVALASLLVACSGKRPAPPATTDAVTPHAGAVPAATGPPDRAAPAAAPTVTQVPLPGGDGGIGFDDLQYEP
jgi:hypothetical protein